MAKGLTIKGFYIEMDVQDSSGNSLKRIDSTVTGGKVVLTIYNTSILNRGLEIGASLPNGRSSIELVPNGTAASQWTTVIRQIPQNSVRTSSCPLRRNGGGANKNEPIQCDKISEEFLNIFHQIRDRRIPFDIVIHAA